MPQDLLKRIDLGKLHAPFLELVLDMLARCRAEGFDYYAISGFRDYAEQDALYEQGRTAAGARVTNARGGESAHNFGLAVDLCRDGLIDRRGLQPDWRPASYDMLGRYARAVGLVWGGDFAIPDRPHVQLAGYVTAEELRPLRAAFERGGLAEAWSVVEKAANPIPR